MSMIRGNPYCRSVSADSVTGVSAPAAREDSRFARLGSYWWPVAAWLGATTAMVLWCVAQGWAPFSASRTWSRFDSSYYLQIAEHGYTIGRCHQTGGWCGNTAWLPGYPWLVGGLTHLGTPLAPTALGVSWLFGLGTLLLIWTAMPQPRSRGSIIAIAYAAVAPGVVYSYAVFPISLLTFFTTAFLLLLARGRHVLGGIAAGVATLTYPLAIVAAPAGALWLLTDRCLQLRHRIYAAAIVLLPTITALVLFVTDQRLETKHWNAFFLGQRFYQHHLRDPFSAVIDAASGLSHGRVLQSYHAIGIQTLLVTFVMLCVVVELIARHRSALRFDWLVALWAIATWVTALVQTNVSIWRGEAALLPVAILVRRLPVPLAVSITASAFLVMLAITRLYLRHLLW
jgi:hypothetical protein